MLRSWLPAYGASLLATIGLALSSACSSPAPLGGSGASCEQPSDCANNLFCVPQSNGSRICSSNLGPIQHTEEAGADAAPTRPKGDGSAPANDAGTSGGDSSSAPTDSGTKLNDSGSPPQDSGTVKEAASD